MDAGQPDDATTDEADYYLDASGLLVFTSGFLRRRGECCGNKCRHCPFGWANVPAGKVGAGEKPTDSAVARSAS